MERCRKKFYCYDCGSSQSGNPFLPIQVEDSLLKKVYCNECREWKPVAKTSIKYEQKYIIVNWKVWSIIDNDKEIPDIIVEGKNRDLLEEICRRLNSDPEYNRCTAYLDYIEHTKPLGELDITFACQSLYW